MTSGQNGIWRSFLTFFISANNVLFTFQLLLSKWQFAYRFKLNEKRLIRYRKSDQLS